MRVKIVTGIDRIGPMIVSIVSPVLTCVLDIAVSRDAVYIL